MSEARKPTPNAARQPALSPEQRREREYRQKIRRLNAKLLKIQEQAVQMQRLSNRQNSFTRSEVAQFSKDILNVIQKANP